MKPRIGIVGGGTFGTMHLRAAAQAQRAGLIEIAGLADIDPQVRRRQAEAFGVEVFSSHRELVEKALPHAVAVVTPDHLHRQVTLDCLDAGLHVLVEKPMATTLEDALAMHRKARERGLLLQVDFHKRYDPYHRRLRRAVQEGRLGRMQYGCAFVENRIEVPTEMLRAWSADSSPMWFLGVHKIDLMMWLMGGRPVRVYATGVRRLLREMGIDTWDSISARIELDTGAFITVDASWVLPPTFEAIINQGIRLVGDAGICEIDGQDRGHREFRADAGETLNLGFFEEVPEGAPVPAPPERRPAYAGYGIDSITHFYHNTAFLLAGGDLAELEGTFPGSADGVRVTQVGAAAHESARSGTVVELEDLPLA